MEVFTARSYEREKFTSAWFAWNINRQTGRGCLHDISCHPYAKGLAVRPSVQQSGSRVATCPLRRDQDSVTAWRRIALLPSPLPYASGVLPLKEILYTDF